MQKANRPQLEWRMIIFFLTALLIVVADQLTKAWIRSYPEGRSLFEIGFVRIVRVENSGAAFGIFRDQRLALVAISTIAVLALVLFLLPAFRRNPYLDNALSRPALALILGGTIGNLIDRLRIGHVTDFVSVGFWPAFNVADASITVGVILFASSLILLPAVKRA